MRSRCQDNFGMILDSCLNDVGSHVGMMLLLLSITFWGQIPDNAKPMSRILRSRCQYYSAKPMSKRMRNRCQGDREADVENAFTRAHAEWKYTRTQRVPWELGGNVSRASWVGTCPVRVRPRSRYREGVHTRTRWMEVHTHTNKLTPNGNTQSDMFYLCLHWLLAFLLFP